MAGRFETRLKDLGIELPTPTAPVANYVPYTISGKILFVSGQVTLLNGKLEFVGKVGREFDVAQGAQAARICGLNLIAQARAACGGNLDKISRVLRLGGFVNCVDGFANQPEVVNGASDLMVEVFGDAGRHARAAVGVNALPRNVAVEVEATFELI